MFRVALIFFKFLREVKRVCAFFMFAEASVNSWYLYSPSSYFWYGCTVDFRQGCFDWGISAFFFADGFHPKFKGFISFSFWRKRSRYFELSVQLCAWLLGHVFCFIQYCKTTLLRLRFRDISFASANRLSSGDILNAPRAKLKPL